MSLPPEGLARIREAVHSSPELDVLAPVVVAGWEGDSPRIGGAAFARLNGAYPDTVAAAGAKRGGESERWLTRCVWRRLNRVQV